MYYIYALVDPVNRMPFYIGKGKGSRCYDHLNGADKSNKKKVHMIKTIRSLNLEPEIHFIAENIDNESYAYNLEFCIIKNSHLFGLKLTNRVGIDMRPPCRKGAKMSDDVKKKISMSLTGRPGKPLSIDAKLKISAANRGKIISSQTRDKISSTLKSKNRALVVPKEELFDLYVTQNLTRDQIAQKYGMKSRFTIDRYLEKYGITKRITLKKKNYK